jgi:RNA polymerase sigma-70 factor (ECF subfamily)
MTPTHSAETAAVLAAQHARFLAFLRRRVPSREVAEDLLQEAFVRGLTKAPALESDESAVAWFYRVLRNAVTDYYRRAGAEARALERLAQEVDPVAPEDSTLFGEICQCVRDLVTGLKADYADAIEAVDLGGVPVTAYADRAGITANNAGVRLHRARRALAARVHEV